MVARDGIEPPTHGFSIRRKTHEMKGSDFMSQTKGDTISKISTTCNSFLKSLLQIEDEDLSSNEKEQALTFLSEVLIQSEITLDKIKMKIKH